MAKASIKTEKSSQHDIFEVLICPFWFHLQKRPAHIELNITNTLPDRENFKKQTHCHANLYLSGAHMEVMQMIAFASHAGDSHTRYKLPNNV